MRPPVFVTDPAGLAADPVVLTGPEGRHAATVRRLAPGERADVTDGAGHLAECTVTAAGPGTVELAVLARRHEPPPEPRLAVIQAIAKGDRSELAVELLTEVGADVIVPWQAERCVAQWRGDRAGRGLERWRRTAQEAAKQSRRARFPEVTTPVTLPGAAARAAVARLAVILDPDALDALAGLPLPASGEIVLIVGPEGGLSQAEASQLAAAGARPARLGPTVMRTSTAGAAAAAAVLCRTGRWAATPAARAQ